MSWAPIAAAGIQAGGSLLGGLIGQSGQAATNAQQMAMMQQSEQFNAQQALEQRTWEQQMSDTAYQRAMKDMKTAGLNPILAANLGGASTPGGSSASISSPTIGNPGAAMQAGITSASQAGQVYMQSKVLQNQSEKDSSQTDLNKATEGLTNDNASKTRQDEKTSRSAETLNNAATTVKATEAVLNAANAAQANSAAGLNTQNTELQKLITDQNRQFGISPVGQAVGGLIKMFETGKGWGSGNSAPTAPGGPYQAPFKGLHNEPYDRVPSTRSWFDKESQRPLGTPR